MNTKFISIDFVLYYARFEIQGVLDSTIAVVIVGPCSGFGAVNNRGEILARWNLRNLRTLLEIALLTKTGQPVLTPI